MGVKTLIFLGLVFSTLLMYLCINAKKDELYASLVKDKVTPVVVSSANKEPKIIEKSVKVIEEPPVIDAVNFPSFAYVFGKKENEKDKAGGFLAVSDKKSTFIKEIDALCKDDACVKEIKYFDDVKTFAFSKEIVNFIKYAKAEKIKDFALYLDKDELSLEGTLTSQEQSNELKTYINAFTEQGYKLNDKLKRENLIPLVSEVNTVSLPAKETPKEVTETYKPTVEDMAHEINTLLANNPISFEYSSSAISASSKETLITISDILLGLEHVSVEVAGHTDARGEEAYNKRLSQQRADSVRKFLIKLGVRKNIIKAVGYGEEYPIGDPEDIINRRVEIHLKEGE